MGRVNRCCRRRFQQCLVAKADAAKGAFGSIVPLYAVVFADAKQFEPSISAVFF
jgi:hypothetical protein